MATVANPRHGRGSDAPRRKRIGGKPKVQRRERDLSDEEPELGEHPEVSLTQDSGEDEPVQQSRAPSPDPTTSDEEDEDVEPDIIGANEQARSHTQHESSNTSSAPQKRQREESSSVEPTTKRVRTSEPDVADSSIDTGNVGIFRRKLREYFGIRAENFEEQEMAYAERGGTGGWANAVVNAFAKIYDVENLSTNELKALIHDDSNHFFACVSPNTYKDWDICFFEPRDENSDCSMSIVYRKRGARTLKGKDKVQLATIVLPVLVAKGMKLTGLGYVTDKMKYDPVTKINDRIEKNHFHLRLEPQQADADDADPNHVVVGEYASLMLKRRERHLLKIMFDNNICQNQKKKAWLQDILIDPSKLAEYDFRREGQNFVDNKTKKVVTYKHPKVYSQLLEKWMRNVATSRWQKVEENEDTGQSNINATEWESPDNISMSYRRNVFRQTDEKKTSNVVLNQHGGVKHPASLWKHADSNPHYAIEELAEHGYSYQPVTYRNRSGLDCVPASERLTGLARFEDPKCLIGKNSLVMVTIFDRGSSLKEGKHAIKPQFVTPIVIIKQVHDQSNADSVFRVAGEEVTQAYSIKHQNDDEHRLIVD